MGDLRLYILINIRVSECSVYIYSESCKIRNNVLTRF